MAETKIVSVMMYILNFSLFFKGTFLSILVPIILFNGQDVELNCVESLSWATIGQWDRRQIFISTRPLFHTPHDLNFYAFLTNSNFQTGYDNLGQVQPTGLSGFRFSLLIELINLRKLFWLSLDLSMKPVISTVMYCIPFFSWSSKSNH